MFVQNTKCFSVNVGEVIGHDSDYEPLNQYHINVAMLGSTAVSKVITFAINENDGVYIDNTYIGDKASKEYPHEVEVAIKALGIMAKLDAKVCSKMAYPVEKEYLDIKAEVEHLGLDITM